MKQSTFSRMKNVVEGALAWFFGALLIILSVVVSFEVFIRKVFNISLQGADELSGYILAIGSTITFGLAIIGRSHIRVDLAYNLASQAIQNALNILSIAAMSIFSVFLLWMAGKVIQDTMFFGSTAPTSWATPLVYPQSVWLLTLLFFSMISVCFFVWAVVLLLQRKTRDANNLIAPKGAEEELKEEMENITERQRAAG